MDLGSASDVPPDVPSQDALELLQQDAQRNKRRTKLVLFILAPLVAVGGGAAWYFLGEKAAREQIQGAWDGASACLVGAPLGAGERASLRMRAIQLAAVHGERDQKSESRWPARCADAVGALHEALRRHGRTGDGEQGLGARSEKLAVTLRKADVMHDLSQETDGLFDAAHKQGLAARAVTLAVPTPEPAKAFNLDTLPPSARISGLQHTLDSVSSTPMIGTEIHALVYDRKVDETPVLCVFRRQGADRCTKLGGELVGKSGLRLGGTVDEGASPLVLAGRKGDAGIYRSAGAFEKITALAAQSAYVAKDGYVAVAGYSLDRDEGHFKLVQQPAPGAPPSTITIGPEHVPGKPYQLHRWGLLWGKLMLQALFKDGGRTRPKLFYANLPIAKKPRFFEIAEVDWLNARIFGCRAADTMVVGVGVTRGFVTFLEKDRWSTPVALAAISGALSCHSGEVVFTNGYGGQDRCTPAGCTLKEGVAPTFEPFPVRERYWADLDGKVLAVASTDKRGGLRYRWASGDNLGAQGGDRVLFDDLVKDGAVQKDSTLLGLLLGGRGKFAVVLLTTPKGVYALRFDADGNPKPATIRTE